MFIYAKIGTWPGAMYKALRKKNTPAVGDKLMLRGMSKDDWEDYSVLVREVRDVGERFLFVVERW